MQGRIQLPAASLHGAWLPLALTKIASAALQIRIQLPVASLQDAWLPVALTTMARLLRCQVQSSCLCTGCPEPLQGCWVAKRYLTACGLASLSLDHHGKAAKPRPAACLVVAWIPVAIARLLRCQEPVPMAARCLGRHGKAAALPSPIQLPGWLLPGYLWPCCVAKCDPAACALAARSPDHYGKAAGLLSAIQLPVV